MYLATGFSLLLLAAGIAVLPFFILMLASSLAGILRRQGVQVPMVPSSRFLVMIPAHDEEAGIAATVKSCRAQEYPADLFEIVVIADNCTDATAAIARREGAAVVERTDPVKRSKGYAMEYLIEQLHASGRFDQLDALVIIDADSTASPNLLSTFSRMLVDGCDWIQCRYTVSNPDDSWRTRLMTYAFSLINGIVPLGQYLLGSSAAFRGNGMCFSTRGLRRIPWRTYGLVEDIEFSWTVRVAGERIAFAPDVSVQGVMLRHGGAAAASQRKRWEFGRRELRSRMLKPLLQSPHLGLGVKIASVVELLMPSMVGLMMAFCILFASSTAVLIFFWNELPTAIKVALIVMNAFMAGATAVHAVSPFVVFRLPLSYALSLVYLPFFAIWKIGVNLSGRPVQWIRTAREKQTKPA